MKTIKAQKLTAGNFAKYGSFADLLNPSGEKIGSAPVEFFRDMAQLKSLQVNSASFSVCRVAKREMVIEASECHNYCSEGSIPLDGDVIVYVAPASCGDIPEDKIEAFFVPKGTFISLNPGVWHQAAYPSDAEIVNVAVILPERTYVNDCRVVNLKEKVKIED